MKKFSLLSVLLAGLTLTAATTGDYLFNLNVDETTKDLSGNERHPLNFFAESDWFRGDMEGILFHRPADVLKLPVSALALPQGSVEMTVRLADLSRPQTLMLCYSSADNLQINITRERLQVSYFLRSQKKRHRLTDYKRLVKPNCWHKIRMTYRFPGEIALYVDGKLTGKMKVDSMFTIGRDPVLLLGNDQVGGKVMLNGVIHRATFTDQVDAAPEPRGSAQPSVSAPMQVGGFDLQWGKSNGGVSLLGMRSGKTEFLSPVRREPVWRIRLYNAKKKKYVWVDSLESDGEIGSTDVRWKKAALPDGGTFPVTLSLASAENGGIDWRLETGNVPEGWAVDSVVYPILSLAPTGEDPKEMFLTYPAYCGRNKKDPFCFESKRSGLRYGNAYGGGAHFQFCFLYGKDRPGLFIMTPDAEGYIKEFFFTAFPGEKSLVFTLEQYPEQRAVSRRYRAAYPVRTAAMEGDWFDAAKRYRQWAIRQKWCAQGVLEKRTDLPQWIRECDLAARPAMSNSHDPKVVGALLDAISRQSRFLSERFPTETLNAWYYYKRGRTPDATTVGLRNGWGSSALNGHWDVENIPGVKAILRELAQQRFHTVGYINSIIYDQAVDPNDPETRAILPSVMRNVDGSLFLYGKLLYYCCRGDEAWQKQLLRIMRRDSEELGFAGMYLDSFGRGSNFCYAKNHGHEPGDSRGSIRGQLEMAELLRREMRAAIPGYILSSEASIEQFVSAIDVKLHHHNIHTESVPIWAAVYHDYQFVYGRYADLPEVNTTAIFHMGGILGRYFTSKPEFFRTHFENENAIVYTRQLIALRQKYRNRIGMGEMLRPPTVRCAEPDRRVTSRKMKLVVPAIQGSAWKECDGGAVLVFTNSTEKPLEFTFALKAGEFDAYGKNAWKAVFPKGDRFEEKPYRIGDKLTLPPLSAMAIDLGRP